MSRLPVRLRVTLVFTAVMAVVLAATGVFVYDRLRSDLDDAINADLSTRARALATAIRVSDAGLGEPARSILRDPRQGFAQVLTADGAIFDPRVQHGASVLGADDLGQAAQRPVTVDLTGLPGQGGDRGRVLATPIDFEKHRLITVVADSLADRDHALESLRELLLVGGPIALLLAALTAYGTVAAALRPVEAMRSRAEAISGARATERLPVAPARDELRRLGETLNAMLDRVQSALERERAFVDDASHELRSPLAAQRTELEMALRYGGSTDELRTAIASAMDEAERLSRLTEDLLLLARADKDGLLPGSAGVGIADLFRTVARLFPEEGREMAVDDTAGLQVKGDSVLLEHALSNLVENAQRHGGEEIRLSARAVDGRIELHVTDNGPGFPPEFLPHAFERFRRADAARSSPGTGLGLAIVAAIAQAHGGAARAANGASGADVWIELPSGQ